MRLHDNGLILSCWHTYYLSVSAGVMLTCAHVVIVQQCTIWRMLIARQG